MTKYGDEKFDASIPVLLTTPSQRQYNKVCEKAHEVRYSTVGSIWTLLIVGASMGLMALFGFLWGVKNGAFENAEDAKYIVFRDEDEDE